MNARLTPIASARGAAGPRSRAGSSSSRRAPGGPPGRGFPRLFSGVPRPSRPSRSLSRKAFQSFPLSSRLKDAEGERLPRSARASGRAELLSLQPPSRGRIARALMHGDPGQSRGRKGLPKPAELYSDTAAEVGFRRVFPPSLISAAVVSHLSSRTGA